ncbi:MAG: FixH family protein [Xanthomonadales bacterium]|nr:FixH family protein [Xanthomonadales bacterium]
MSVVQLMAEPEIPAKAGLPWHWLIFLPVLASVIAGLTTLGIAIRYGDKPLPESVMRTGPVQHGDSQPQLRAQSLGLSATAQLDPAARGIVLELAGRDLPQQLSLRLWHPTDAGLDQVLTLTRSDDGRYRGVWPAQTQGLLLLLSSPEQGWEMPGATDVASNTLRFQP